VTSALIIAFLPIPGIAQSAPQRAGRMLSNTPFEARAQGLLGAVEVEAPQQRGQADIDIAVQEALRKIHPPSALQRRQRLEEFLRKAKRLKPGQKIRYDRRIVLTDNGRPILPVRDSHSARNARFGNGTITYQFSGFSTADEAAYRGFITAITPHLDAIYGKPSSNITVTIRFDTNADTIDGGFYNVTTKSIHFYPFGELTGDTYTLTHLILHAYHDELQFSFDGWEEGFTRAAATLAFLRYDPSIDLLDTDGFYHLPLYDGWNQPALGNSSFFSPSNIEVSGMPYWRLGMAQAAWLKVTAENPDFFRGFNEAYYAQFTPGLEGNTPALKQIAQGLAPNVEGLGFSDWYRRQYILDTSNSPGTKLYVATIAQPISVVLVIEHYTTTPDGDETPLNGMADLVYRNDESPDLFAEEGNEAEIENGEGFIAPQFFNIGGANLIFVDVAAGGLQTTVLFPYNVAHESVLGDPDNIFGGVTGSASGSLDVAHAVRSVPATAQTTRSVFAYAPDIAMNALQRLEFTYNASDTGQSVTVSRNTGWGYYQLLLHSPVTITSLSHLYQKGSTGYQMVALPGRPLLGDEASVFGVPANRFLMAKWRPDMAGENKYELYPNIITPLGPGVGSWVKLENDVNVSVQAEPISTDEDFRIHLPSGFNQIGAPVDATFDIANLFVQVPGGAIQSFGAAQAAGLVSGGVFGFVQSEGYRLTTSLSGWNGYWMRVTSVNGIDLIFPTQGMVVSSKVSGFGFQVSGIQGSRDGTRSAGSPKRRSGSLIPHPSSLILPGTVGLDQKQMRRNDWSFRISASTSVAKDLDNYLGVTPLATDGLDNVHDIVQPPEFGPYVSLYFPSRSAQGDMPLAVDLRAPFTGKKQWDFEVTTNLGDTEVTLTWDDLRKAPRPMRFRLADVDAQSVLDMQKVGFCRFRTGNNSTRRFQIAVFGGPRPLAKISRVDVRRIPGRLLLTFKSSGPVDVDAEIYNARGQRLRRLKAKQISAAGDYAMQWDLRDARGQRAAGGVYVVRLTAVDEAKRTHRVVRMFHLERTL